MHLSIYRLGEFALAGIVAFVVFVIIGSFQFVTSERTWETLFDQGTIGRKEYYENRFSII